MARYFEMIEGPSVLVQSTHTFEGWLHLISRFEVAKDWARRNGKTQVAVRRWYDFHEFGWHLGNVG